VPGMFCQPAEIGIFLGEITKGKMASWIWAEYFYPTGNRLNIFTLRPYHSLSQLLS
jgi:hypothetical protein